MIPKIHPAAISHQFKLLPNRFLTVHRIIQSLQASCDPYIMYKVCSNRYNPLAVAVLFYELFGTYLGTVWEQFESAAGQANYFFTDDFLLYQRLKMIYIF